ncbi:uncharacterized protein TRIVIDRAFT_51371 [Trichoderma virens Gv29-8]|uniref:Proteasome assembly chaperone 3 n=1 Tax=Hypocrea virens (strain Gv29-8 / FGSC 10586) TaxID=413071 RepID=G9NDU7_HYPVG|nr:uncharacterized protein TRIVIDRAFT_51371 [Trichoderma virens Gv29-8]EHK15196.1 hypothetical protein TRIVIDRAFT_51371 [Trichoderma virens Gv29-8]UKZ58035.1 hypothetical protein TrVGV298_011896 [Trichoderma virens]UKZ83734.1 hypothetical protein TrVFT333_011543 [Trichoderma virens FT-333]
MATDSNRVVQVSIPLPRSLDTRIFIRITTQAKAILISLTTVAQEDAAAPRPMGSFVYALPDRFNHQQSIATTLFSAESSLEFTTRVAKLVARKTELPVYVTNSISLESMGMGGTVEEEMEAFKSVAEAILSILPKAALPS